MSEFKVYDFDQVVFILGGLPITCNGEGTGIKITQLDPDFVTVVGVDGSVTRSKTKKRLTKIEATLLQSSSANAILSALNNIDRLATNGAGVVPVMVKDNGGLSLVAGQHAWIEGPPTDAEYAGEAKNRVWVIMVAHPERTDGGN
jgi:hypothetical protein